MKSGTRIVLCFGYAFGMIYISTSFDHAFKSVCMEKTRETRDVLSGIASAPDAITEEDELLLDAMIQRTRDASESADSKFEQGEIAGGVQELLNRDKEFYESGEYARNVGINAKRLAGPRLEWLDRLKVSNSVSSCARNSLKTYAGWTLLTAIAYASGWLAFSSDQQSLWTSAFALGGGALGVATGAALGLVISGPWGAMAAVFSVSIGVIVGLIAILIPLVITMDSSLLIEGDEIDAA